MAANEYQIVAEQFPFLLRDFLQRMPLLTKMRVNFPEPVPLDVVLEGVPDALDLNCSKCGKGTTFKILRSGTSREPIIFAAIDPQRVPNERHVRLAYRCADCEKDRASFWYVISIEKPAKVRLGGTLTNTGLGGTMVDATTSFTVQKIGQWPAWSISISKRLEKALGDHAGLYKSGLICLGQGFGIGAAAYFRRCIEGATDALLALLEESATLDPDEELQKAIEEAKRSTVAGKKLELVKDVLPAHLRPGNTNPLDLLFSQASPPLHATTEEEGQQTAEEIRESMEFLFEGLHSHIERAKKFSSKMKKLSGQQPKST